MYSKAGKKMVESNSAINQVFNDEWVKELRTKGIFTGDSQEWFITEDNVTSVLQAISVNAAHYKTIMMKDIKASAA